MFCCICCVLLVCVCLMFVKLVSNGNAHIHHMLVVVISFIHFSLSKHTSTDTIKCGIQKGHKNPVKSTSSTIVSNLPSRNQPTIYSINAITNSPVFSTRSFPRPNPPIVLIGHPKNVPNFVNWYLKNMKTCGRSPKRWVDQYENVSRTIWVSLKPPRIFDRYDV